MFDIWMWIFNILWRMTSKKLNPLREMQSVLYLGYICKWELKFEWFSHAIRLQWNFVREHFFYIFFLELHAASAVIRIYVKAKVYKNELVLLYANSSKTKTECWNCIRMIFPIIIVHFSTRKLRLNKCIDDMLFIFYKNDSQVFYLLIVWFPALFELMVSDSYYCPIQSIYQCCIWCILWFQLHMCAIWIFV